MIEGLGDGRCASEWGGRETGPCLYDREEVLAMLAAERERCAKVCESIARDELGMTNLREYGECAAAIRARNQP